VFRCEATGANFGPDVQEFSGSNKAVGCALFADPRNACGPVHFKPPNTTVYCDTYFAVVARGNCSFSEKAFNVQTAEPFGFDALIVYNEMNKGGPIPMSGSIHAQDVTIPSVMINHACMKEVMTHYSSAHGYSVTMKASPGYYDLIKYLVPFVVIVGFCFIILFISLVSFFYFEIHSTLGFNQWILDNQTLPGKKKIVQKTVIACQSQEDTDQKVQEGRRYMRDMCGLLRRFCGE
jgi:hypothetical protein